MFDYNELNSYESDDSVPTSPVNNRYKIGKGYHVVPPPYTGTFMPPKPDLVFNDAPPDSEIVLNVTSDSKDESKPESVSKQKEPSFVPTNDHVKTPRMTHPHSNTHVVPTAVLTRSKSVMAWSLQKTLSFLFDVQGNPQQALKDKGVIDSGYSRHMTGNISYLLDFEEINRGYVAFGGNPQGDTECVVLSSNFKLPDENHVLLRVLRENNMYNVDLKNVVSLGDLTCVFAKVTLDKSNLWHRRLGHIYFKTMNKLVKERKNITLIEAARTMLAVHYYPSPFGLRTPSIGFMRPFGCPATILNTLNPLGKFDGKADEGFLVGYSVNSKAFRVFNCRTKIVQETLHINFLENQPNVAGSGPKWLFGIDILTQTMIYQPVVTGNQPNHNADADAAFDVKENDNEVYVSLGGSDKTKKHDEKAKRKAKGKNPVDLSTRVRDLKDEFEEFSSNNTNMVNAASAPVTTAGPNPTNSTNIFNAASLTVNEDIVYSDDEENVGAEVDLSNLEINISVSPIPTTRVYKDHPITQIIGDLTSAPQTMSMARMVKEQGGLNQINDEDFHTCMFACFLSQEEPKRVHQTLKDLSWIEAIQKEILQFKMQKVWVMLDLPKGKRAIGSKWFFRNKKDKSGIVIKNKAKLVAQGHT
uniref:Uncharacterized protein n=1 Tax=Tanacetum cinerariifolium TaxID=118510 RepID=A0A6L2KC89_TANCI|nr:hypothetical protein [Tanacetum cinerariifolium]